MKNISSEQLYCHCVSKAGFGLKFKDILEIYKSTGSFEGVWNKISKSFSSRNKPLDFQQELKILEDTGVKISTCKDSDFPKKLLELAHPPLLIYFLGDLEAYNSSPDNKLGVVGTRKVTSEGVLITSNLVTGLAGSSTWVVSGLAFGVDILAHQTAVKQGLPTLAVLGGGLSEKAFYPKQHFNFARKIVQSGGIVLSEYPPDSPALKQNFIARNRIVAALSDKLLVIECPEKSGVLSTVRFAIENSKDVLVVPGSTLNPNYVGSNKMIFDGASLVRDFSDLALHLGINPSEKKTDLSCLDEDSLGVMKILSSGKIFNFEELLAQTSTDLKTLNSVLGRLELSNHVKQVTFGHYVAI